MPILVTGATGNVGRHVVSALARAGESVRAFTRNAAAPFPPGVDLRGRGGGTVGGIEVVVGDLARPETVRPALDNVDRMYLFPLAYLKPVIQSFDDVRQTTGLVAMAVRAGVRRLVMLGSSDPDLAELEREVERSGLEWTILRPGEFAVNKLDYWAPSIRSEGVVRAAYADARGTPIHEADIADAAVAALLEPGHVGMHYELTGPEALTLREQVAAIAAGIGRDIRFEELTHDQARAELIGHGLPAAVVDELILWYPPEYATLTPELHPVERVTGRPGRTLTQWAADHTDDFREGS